MAPGIRRSAAACATTSSDPPAIHRCSMAAVRPGWGPLANAWRAAAAHAGSASTPRRIRRSTWAGPARSSRAVMAARRSAAGRAESVRRATSGAAAGERRRARTCTAWIWAMGSNPGKAWINAVSTPESTIPTSSFTASSPTAVPNRGINSRTSPSESVSARTCQTSPRTAGAIGSVNAARAAIAGAAWPLRARSSARIARAASRSGRTSGRGARAASAWVAWAPPVRRRAAIPALARTGS